MKTPEQTVLKTNEYWHGGGWHGGPPLHSMYVCKDLKAAQSYVNMAKDRGIPGAALKQVRVNLVRGAIPSIVMHAARDVGIDNEGNTPASVFDPELHGASEVRALVYKLMGQGFDHAVNLEDIGYGVQREFNATVLFRNTNPKLVKAFTGDTIMTSTTQQTAKMDPNSKLADPVKRKLKSISETIDQQRDLFFKCTDPDKREGIRSVLNALKHQFNQIYSQLYGTPYFALATTKVTAGSWGKKPLQTDDTATDFDMAYERFEKLLVWAERKAIRGLTKPNDNEYNLYPSGVGFVVWMMQHNAIMSTALKQAVLNWVRKQASEPEITKAFKNEVLKFGLAVRKYKPFVRKDLGVRLDAMIDQMSDERTETLNLEERPGYRGPKEYASVTSIKAIARLKEFAAEIKPQNRGLLHKKLGIPEDEKIPLSRLHEEKKKAKDSGDTALEKEVDFAINFHHKD